MEKKVIQTIFIYNPKTISMHFSFPTLQLNFAIQIAKNKRFPISAIIVYIHSDKGDLLSKPRTAEILCGDYCQIGSRKYKMTPEVKVIEGANKVITNDSIVWLTYESPSTLN